MAKTEDEHPQGDPTADVMIRCPKTGEPVPTDIGMDFATFRPMQESMTGNRVRCRACGDMHVWDGKDAFPDS